MNLNVKPQCLLGRIESHFNMIQFTYEQVKFKLRMQIFEMADNQLT